MCYALAQHLVPPSVGHTEAQGTAVSLQSLRASSTTLPSWQCLTCWCTLEGGPLSPIFLVFKVSPVNITQHPLDSNKVLPFPAWLRVTISFPCCS